MSLLAVLIVAVWVPVTPQVFSPPTGSGGFPSNFGSSFPLPQTAPHLVPSSAFQPGQSLPLSTGGAQRPFDNFQSQRPQQQLPVFSPTTTTTTGGAGSGQKNHTYPDGTMGGDYPSHLAAKQKGSEPSKQHTYPDGTTGDDYPSRMAAKQAQQQRGGPGVRFSSQASANDPQSTFFNNNPNAKKRHTYPDGTTGDNYPSRMAAKQAKQQQQQQPFPASQFLNPQFAAGANDRNIVVKNPSQVPHTYPDGTTGHNYPSQKAQQQQLQQQQSAVQFGQRFPAPFQVPHQGTNKNSPNQGTHTYPDGTTGGDYPKMAAQKQQQQQQQPFSQFGGFPAGFPVPQVGGDVKKNPSQVQHTYSDGTTGGDYPSKKAAQKQQQQQQSPPLFTGSFPVQFQVQAGNEQRKPDQVLHTYPGGTTGGDYPSKMAAKQHQQRQQQQKLQPPPQFSGGFPAQFNVARQVGANVQKSPTQILHTNPDGTTGGGFPSKMAAQKQQQQQQQPIAQFGSSFPVQFRVPQVNGDVKKNPTQVLHTYPDGTTGGDYPSKMAAQKQQQTSSAAHFGSGFPAQLLVPQDAKKSSSQVQHTFADGTTGGDYPSKKAAQQKSGGISGESFPSNLAGAVPQQFTVPSSPRKVPLPPQRFLPVQTSAGDFRGSQVFPSSISQKQPFPAASVLPKTRSQVSIPGALVRPPSFIPNTAPGGSSSGTRTYPDGTTGDDYPSHKARQAAGGTPRVPQTFPGGTGNAFLPSSQRSPFGGQCFRYQDLAASYKLSDVNDDYPEDDILSELGSNPHLLPMVGFKSLPKTKDTSPFASFGDSFKLPSSFSFDFTGKQETRKLSNVKQFPANFDKNTLGQAMVPVDSTCPSTSLPLRALTIDSKRCSVVNADYQDITYAKCSRRACSQCGSGSGGVSACVERYSWMAVMVYCPHWQRGQRINSVRVYLPQSCSCQRFQC